MLTKNYNNMKIINIARDMSLPSIFIIFFKKYQSSRINFWRSNFRDSYHIFYLERE